MKFGFGRRFLFGFVGMSVAVAATWFLPGATGHGMHDLVAQAAPVPTQQPAATPPPVSQPAAGQATTAAAGIQQPAPPPPPPVAAPVSLPQRFTGLIGIALIILLGYALSHHREAVKWKIVAWGLSLQVVFAIFVLRIPFGQRMFRTLGDAVTAALHYSYAGSEFVFGELGKANSSLGRDLRVPGAAGDHLHLGAVRHPLLPRRHAGGGARLRGGDEQAARSQRRREPQRRRVDLHGTDRGAAHHPARSFPR